jgi:hypothetical protein
MNPFKKKKEEPKFIVPESWKKTHPKPTEENLFPLNAEEISQELGLKVVQGGQTHKLHFTPQLPKLKLSQLNPLDRLPKHVITDRIPLRAKQGIGVIALLANLLFAFSFFVMSSQGFFLLFIINVFVWYNYLQKSRTPRYHVPQTYDEFRGKKE